MTLALALAAAPLLAVVTWDLLRKPVVRHLALRGVARRKTEAALVLVGSLLGTAIITSSFVVGDTLDHSIRDVARTELGPVDEVVRVTGLERFAGIARNLTDSYHPAIDGLALALSAPAALAGAGAVEPSALLLEMDFDQGRQLDNDPRATGLGDAGTTPEAGQVVLPADLADYLGVAEGDGLDILAYGTQRRLTVSRVIAKVGLAGFGRPSVFVGPGTIAELSTATPAPASAPPSGLVFVSNAGDTFGGVELTEEAVAHVRAIIGSAAGVEVLTAKQDLLARAEESASAFVDTYTAVGAFSVVAGLLLLVNVFVMLAEERRRELGTMRAMGMRRGLLVRVMAAEGTLYAAVAALLGAGVGLVASRAVVAVADGVLNSGVEERFALDLAFRASTGSIVGGLVIGAGIATITCWATSLRIARLNVVRAIRDLPADGQVGTRPALTLGAVGVVVGGSLLGVGVAREHALALLGGGPLLAFGLVPLVAGFASRRLALGAATAGSLLWEMGALFLFPDPFAEAPVAVFVVQGVIMVGAAVGLVAANAEHLGAALSRHTSGLGIRLAVAYPSSRRLRTSVLAGTFALVVFAMALLAVLNHLFQAQAPRFLAEARAGFDLVVESNAANPISANDLLAQPEVEAVASITRGNPRFTTPAVAEPTTAALSGFDANFIDDGTPALAVRGPGYESDLDVFEAVLASDELVVVSERFLQGPSATPGALVQVGDLVTVTNPRTADQRQLTVAGILTSDYLDHGALVGAPLAGELLGAEAVANRHLVAVADDGPDPASVARELAGRLAGSGASATTMATLIDRALARQEGFIRLMQGYLAIGLAVGTAGLGVLMARAVRERTHHIGVMRALGFSRSRVRQAFLAEAAFVALGGVVMGTALALVVALQLLGNAEVFSQADLSFSVPWLRLAGLAAVSIGASLAIAAIPASRAARIPPAAALRLGDG